MKFIVSQSLRQDEEVGVNSGFKKGLKASKLSAINGQKESHRPSEVPNGKLSDHMHYNSKMPLMMKNPSSTFPPPHTFVAEGPQVGSGSLVLICLPQSLFISPASEVFHI